MIEKTFTITGADNVKLQCYKWMDESLAPKAVFYLVHGSLEHALRYKHVIEKLVSVGYIVYALDLRGHGKSVSSDELMFYFSDKKDGWGYVLDDINIFLDQIKNEYSDLPIYMYGHSMGSFLVREYIQTHGNKIDGVILSGSGVGEPILQSIVQFFAHLTMMLRGSKFKSPLLHHLVYGTLDSMVKDHKIKGDFISRDIEEVHKYQNDPLCNKTCTAEYAYEMLKGITNINKKSGYVKSKFKLPIYIMSGAEDPVGGKGKGINKMRNMYKDVGFDNITIKIYPEARHELFNELNRDEVINDMISWLNNGVKNI